MEAIMLEQRMERLIAEFRAASEKVADVNPDYSRVNIVQHEHQIKTPVFTPWDNSGAMEQTGSVHYRHRIDNEPTPEENEQPLREREYCERAEEAMNQIIALENCQSGNTQEGYKALVNAIKQFRNTYVKGTEGYQSQVKLDFSLNLKKTTEEIYKMQDIAKAYSVSVNPAIRKKAENALSFIENVISENNDILYHSHGLLSSSIYTGNIRAEAIAMDNYKQEVPDVDIQFERKKAHAPKETVTPSKQESATQKRDPYEKVYQILSGDYEEKQSKRKSARAERDPYEKVYRTLSGNIEDRFPILRMFIKPKKDPYWRVYKILNK
ncbi:hypothetical protein COV21_02015 [Candidatus Woesearchaeota archaeon CG10_big_fil_rev_8_21_14_0_10_45_5]|nr:MAG: hypothetical protein COV21_02015 [Candidatus Woesearchaeota archaeon CG10_big_fil_rev_8_21_14_0_10_45_5]